MATSPPHGFQSKLCFQQPGARLAGLPAGESGDLDTVLWDDRHQVCAGRNPLPLHGAKYGLQTRLLTVPGSLLGMQGQKHYPDTPKENLYCTLILGYPPPQVMWGQLTSPRLTSGSGCWHFLIGLQIRRFQADLGPEGQCMTAKHVCGCLTLVIG